MLHVYYRYMRSGPRHPAVEVHGMDMIVWRRVMQPELFDDLMWARSERCEQGGILEWCVEYYYAFEIMEDVLSEEGDLDRMWTGLVQRKEARDGGVAPPHGASGRWASRR